MSVRADAERFRRIPLFAECDETHLQLLAFTSERMTFAAGDAIVRAGEHGEAGYLIISGTGEVWTARDKGRDTVTTIGPGAFIGELTMIAGLAYPANITATANVTATRVSRVVFGRVVAEFPEFGVRVHRELARRLDLSLAELNRLRPLFEKTLS